MIIRKLLRLDNIKPKTNKSPEISIEATSLKFSGIPNVLKSTIVDFLPDHDKIRMTGVNRDFNQFTKSEVFHKSRFYYAVGANIDLYYSVYEGCSVKKPISEQAFKQTLNEDMILFSDYKTAKQYAQLRQVKTYSPGFDTFFPDSMPAVFVVKLHSPYHKVATTTQIEEIVPNCPAPPAPKTMIASGFKASPNNVKIYYSSFNGLLFNYHSLDGRFSEEWSKGAATHHDLHQSAIAGVLAVFNCYFKCYSSFTRHNQDLVKEIINEAHRSPTIDDLHDFIIATYKKGMQNRAINKSGHYMQMLSFVGVQLAELRSMNKLDGIYEYLT